MKEHVLITGGAGFLGSHLADALLREGHVVRALDNLEPQVHGPDRRRPDYLHRDVELIVGDVRDPGAVRGALRGIDAVYHFAAMVGVGQSMVQIERYVSANTVGTSVLLEAIRHDPIRRLIVASSMSLYGEGLYRSASGAVVAGACRSVERLRAQQWELADEAGDPLSPVATPETKAPGLESVYALSKYDQEQLCLIAGRAHGTPTVALRFFNAYGPRQALSNPYTGVLAIFAARLLQGAPPRIFEDGFQRRDFVSVHDIVRACVSALTAPRAVGRAINVGSGQSRTVREVADALAEVLGRDVRPEITGQHRKGDIRHCFADVSLARSTLGYTPRVSLERGLSELGEWLARQGAPRAEIARGMTP